MTEIWVHGVAGLGDGAVQRLAQAYPEWRFTDGDEPLAMRPTKCWSGDGPPGTWSRAVSDCIPSWCRSPVFRRRRGLAGRVPPGADKDAALQRRAHRRVGARPGSRRCPGVAWPTSTGSSRIWRTGEEARQARRDQGDSRLPNRSRRRRVRCPAADDGSWKRAPATGRITSSGRVAEHRLRGRTPSPRVRPVRPRSSTRRSR
jgi:hypothetical protein